MIAADAGSTLIGGVCFGLLMLALFVGCSFMCLFGIVLCWRAAVLTRNGIRVEGRVVGKVDGGRDTEFRYSIVEFTDLQGSTQQHKLVGASSNDPPVGQSICLLYNPSDPKEVSGSSLGELWMGPVIACTLSGGGLLAVLYVVAREMGILRQI